METLQKICLSLTIIGAINWGMVGLFEFDAVAAIFTAGSLLSRLIYCLVGIAGIVNIGLLVAPLHEVK